jgi:2',3'-cyclic-nucleotide 2'-phosphodiesterase (5'-nucleotidase family)
VRGPLGGPQQTEATQVMSATAILAPRRLTALILTALLVLGSMAAWASPVEAQRPDGAGQPPTAGHQGVHFELTILHNNDGESKLRPSFVPLPGTPSPGPDLSKPYAGVAYFKSLVDILKAEATSGQPARPGAKRGVVMLSSGDNFLAGSEFTASLVKGVPFYDSIAMSLIGYDAIAIGNHEFDFGPDVLADFIRGFSPPVPFLSANLDVSQEPSLVALEQQGQIAKSTVVHERGERIGVIGATTPQLPNISSPRNVVVNAVAPAVQAEVDRLHAAGVNKIILVSHLQNINEDLALAGELTGIDVMIAGGGDELLANPWNPLSPGDGPGQVAGPYPLTATDGAGADLPVITTAGDYKYVGRLVVGFDQRGNVVDIDHERSGPIRVIGFDDGVSVSTSDVPPTNYIVSADPEVQAQVVDPVNAFVAAQAANVLATSEVALEGRRPAIRERETNLGNLTADSMLWQAQQSAPTFGVEIPAVSLQNGGGIRNGSLIPAGPITELNTFEILAFTNFVSVMEEVSGEHLKELLETSISALPSENGRFGHWGGLSFTYDVTAQGRVIDPNTCAVSAEGSRVQTITVGGTTIYAGGSWQVDPDTWTVAMATNDFTFRGGDCYDFRDKSFTTVGVTYQQALANYLTASNGLNGLISAAQYPEVPPAPPQRIIPQ